MVSAAAEVTLVPVAVPEPAVVVVPLEEAASAEVEALLLRRTALLEEAASAEAEALLLQRAKRNCWCLRLGCRRELLSCELHCSLLAVAAAVKRMSRAMPAPSAYVARCRWPSSLQWEVCYHSSRRGLCFVALVWRVADTCHVCALLAPSATIPTTRTG